MTVCEKWKQDPSVNPRTGRQIKPTGKVYKDLEIECANESPSTGSAPKGAVYIDPYAPQAGYVKDCVKWRENPGVSPITGKKLKIDGAAYKQWEEDCKNVKPLPNDMQFKSEFVSINDQVARHTQAWGAYGSIYTAPLGAEPVLGDSLAHSISRSLYTFPVGFICRPVLGLTDGSCFHFSQTVIFNIVR